MPVRLHGEGQNRGIFNEMSAVNHTMPYQTKLKRPSLIQLHEQKPTNNKRKNTNHSGVNKCFLQSRFHAQRAIGKEPRTGHKIKKHFVYSQ